MEYESAAIAATVDELCLAQVDLLDAGLLLLPMSL
jgi:hypothetical protein